MDNHWIKIFGSLDSGIIIQAPRPVHLPGPPQSLVLTPATARELLSQLLELSKKST